MSFQEVRAEQAFKSISEQIRSNLAAIQPNASLIPFLEDEIEQKQKELDTINTNRRNIPGSSSASRRTRDALFRSSIQVEKTITALRQKLEASKNITKEEMNITVSEPKSNNTVRNLLLLGGLALVL